MVTFGCTVPGLDEWTENAQKWAAGPEGRRAVGAIAEQQGKAACCEWANASLNDKNCPDYCQWPINITRKCSSERKGKNKFEGTASKELWCTTDAFEGTEWEPIHDDPFYGVTTRRTARSPIAVWAPGSDGPMPIYPSPPTGRGRRRLRHSTYSLHAWMTPDSIRARLTRLWNLVALGVDVELPSGSALSTAPPASAAKGHIAPRSSSPTAGTSAGVIRVGPPRDNNIDGDRRADDAAGRVLRG